MSGDPPPPPSDEAADLSLARLQVLLPPPSPTLPIKVLLPPPLGAHAPPPPRFSLLVARLQTVADQLERLRTARGARRDDLLRSLETMWDRTQAAEAERAAVRSAAAEGDGHGLALRRGLAPPTFAMLDEAMRAQRAQLQRLVESTLATLEPIWDELAIPKQVLLTPFLLPSHDPPHTTRLRPRAHSRACVYAFSCPPRASTFPARQLSASPKQVRDTFRVRDGDGRDEDMLARLEVELGQLTRTVELLGPSASSERPPVPSWRERPWLPRLAAPRPSCHPCHAPVLAREAAAGRQRLTSLRPRA